MHPIDTVTRSIRNLRDFDDRRAGFNGEHLLALGAGLALFFFAAGRRSPWLRTLARTAASGLIARAAGGRDGVRRFIP